MDSIRIVVWAICTRKTRTHRHARRSLTITTAVSQACDRHVSRSDNRFAGRVTVMPGVGKRRTGGEVMDRKRDKKMDGRQER